MEGIITEDYSTSPRSAVTEGMTSEQRCQSGDSIAEWRSSEQVENGTPSTSPLYWDSDDDDDCGSKPSELYGRFTWKIENFSTINKRELRSNAFEVGGYKWYILIYPQGCDVCNHLSLFLCVANHDKLLPGWSHLAQFTIAVVNKDPKKSKYSDTLHRFWKKEHDWGWKKFMELSKVYDGFIVADTLVIRAQVQVIREKAHHPFRCLDCQYRRELVRVYLSNVEQICRRSVEERREKLKKLIEDKLRWSSFRAFWISIDANSRRRMSRDKSDIILKVVVKHFFIEKEVTSTLVMDSLYSGLKALEYQSKNKKGGEKLIDLEDLPAPMVCVDKDMFALADDVLSLLERAAFEPSPHQPFPPKDDKCPQNRTKEGSSGEEFNKDSIERGERRLMELGRRTVETFVLAHIFSRIEVSYHEAVALKRQEELIREEEAAWQAENELKAKRGASEKDKRAKKKQAKQKRNGRKGKDKGKYERSDVIKENVQPVGSSDDVILDNFHSKPIGPSIEKINIVEIASDLSDNGVDAVKVLQHDLDDRDSSPTNWDTDTSEIHQTLEASCSDVLNGQTEKRSQSVMDDSSSTCSTDSVPSVVTNGPFKGRSLPNNQNHSSNRVKSQRSKETREGSSAHAIRTTSDAVTVDAPSSDISESKVSAPESEAVEISLKNETQQLQKHVLGKGADALPSHKKLSAKDHGDDDRSFKPRRSLSPGKKLPYILQQPKESLEIASTMTSTMAEVASSSEPPSISGSQSDKLLPLSSKLPPIVSTSKSETLKQATPLKNTTAQIVNPLSRPSSAPLIPEPRPTAPVVSAVQISPLLSRSVSAVGRLGTDPSLSAPSYVPQSYRNVMMGKNDMAVGTGVSTHQSASSGQGLTYSQSPSTFLTSTLMLPPQLSVRSDQPPGKLGFIFGSIKPEVVRTRSLLRDGVDREATSSSGRYSSDLVSNMEKLDLYGGLQKRQYSVENVSRVAPYQAQGLVSDEFPHLDIINDLLDEEQTNGNTVNGHLHTFNRQYSFPGHASSMDVGTLSGSFRFNQSEYYDEYFQRSYGSLSTLQRPREGHFSHMDLSTYANGQTDGLMQNRWPYGHVDQSMLNAGNGDVNGYPIQLQGYSNLVGGVNGYLYPPSNGS